MKKYLFIFAGLTVASFAHSQQLQSSSFYDLQGVIHNPSMAGVQKHDLIGATYRTQWSGISGAPKTATLFGSFKMDKHAIGLGGYLYNDQTGPISRSGLNLAFAKLSGDANLVNAEAKKIEQVTTTDIKRVSNQIFRDENSSVLYYQALKN